MAGFADILLRGLILVLGSLALGGGGCLRIVLRAEPHAKPAGPAAIALRAVALAAAGVAAAQALVLLVSLGALVAPDGAWPVGDFFATTFARAAAGRAAGRLAWLTLAVGAAVLVASSAVLSHAMARVDSRAVLVGLDAAHQVAAAVWVGGLAHLTLYAAWRRRHAAALATWPDAASRASGPLLRRFSSVAFWSMAVIVAAGLGLTWLYVGDAAAFVGTAYGVMIVSKVILLLAALCLAYVNMRAVRAAVREPGVRLFRFVEVELGLAVTILFAAASLTSLPPAIDVTTDRASVAEVAARFVPAPPRLTSPPIAELLHS